MSDLRFEVTIEKKNQAVTCKRNRERKKYMEKIREIVKKARMRENKTGKKLM